MMQQQYYKMHTQFAEKSTAINTSAQSSSESGGNDISTASKGSMLYETALADVGSSEGDSTLSLKDQGSGHKKPLVSKIGACGRKIADAVKSVKRDSKAQRGRSDSRVSSGLSNQVKNSAIQ